jgi:hypothetical protein
MKCLDCDNGTVFGCKYCSKCLEKARIRSAARYERLKSQRLCKMCSRPMLADKGIYCENCKIVRSETWFRRKKENICVVCGNRPKTNGLKCESCYLSCQKSTKERCNRKMSAGLCIHCNQPLINKRLCLTHYLKFAAKFHLRTSKRWRELKELFDNQQGICPYTKKKMTLGENASIDHIIPKSRGGTLEITNLQWVYCKVNIMKSDMLKDEFIDLVKTIYEAVV